MPEKKTPSFLPHPDQEGGQGGAVAVVRNLGAGVATLWDWVGDGGKPVAKEQAIARSEVCAKCPKNQPRDLASFFTKPVSERIRLQLEIRNNLDLSLPMDSKLGVCEVCDCPLPLMVFVPLHHKLKHLRSEAKIQLPPYCWVLAEEAAFIAHGQTPPQSVPPAG